LRPPVDVAQVRSFLWTDDIELRAQDNGGLLCDVVSPPAALFLVLELAGVSGSGIGYIHAYSSAFDLT
jgi:hypothetical protein